MKTNFLPLFSLTIGSLLFALLVNSGYSQDTIREQILKVIPQADRNGDKALSDSEYQTFLKQALKRFPQLDKDGDQQLSEKEQLAMLKLAAKRRGTLGKSSAKGKGPRQFSYPANAPKPDHSEIKYGDHQRHVFDLWLVKSSKPTPLAIYIHGGGFSSGSKEKIRVDELKALLDAGISVASINYRYKQIESLPAAHHDCKRALQFIRSKASEWNILKDRIAVFGNSAGAQLSMWIGFSDEMADPKSKDPVERESTRVTCVATGGGQASMRNEYWKTMFSKFGVDASKMTDRKDTFGAKTQEEADKVAKSISALDLMSSDDPPIFMSYPSSPEKAPPAKTSPKFRGFVVHHVQHGIDLKKKAEDCGIESHLSYPGSTNKYRTNVAFMIKKLKAK